MIRNHGTKTFWAAKWHSECRLDGISEHLCWDWQAHGNKLPVLFRTRQEARDFITEKYGYIRRRKDLRIEPHGWKCPVPIKVTVTWKPLQNDQ